MKDGNINANDASFNNIGSIRTIGPEIINEFINWGNSSTDLNWTPEPTFATSGYNVGTNTTDQNTVFRFNYKGDIVLTYKPEENGIVKIYKYNGNSWSQLGGNTIKSRPQHNSYLSSMDINGIGNRVVIGDYNYSAGTYPGDGIVRVFELQNNVWEVIGDIDGTDNSDEGFGKYVSINYSGNVIAVMGERNDFGTGGNNSSEAFTRVYYYNNNNWTIVGNNLASADANTDLVPWKFLPHQLSDAKPIALNKNPGENDGIRFVVGEFTHDNEKGRVRVYQWNGGVWNNFSTGSWEIMSSGTWSGITNGRLGWAVAINGEGNIVTITQPGNFNNFMENFDFDSKVFIKRLNGETWDDLYEIVEPTTSNHNKRIFGWSVDINTEGNIISVSAPTFQGPSGPHVYIYKLDYSTDTYNSLKTYTFTGYSSALKAVNISLSGTGDRVGINSEKIYSLADSNFKTKSITISADISGNDASFNNINLLGDISANDASFNSLFINGNITSTGILDVDKIAINAPVVVTSQSVNKLATFSINETDRDGVSSSSNEDFVASFRPNTGNDAYILVRGDAGNNSKAGIFFGTPSANQSATGNNSCAIIALEQNGSTNSKNDLHFCFSDGNADAVIGDSKVVIDSDGNVGIGIGTTSASYKLDVDGQVGIGSYIYIKPYSWVQHNSGSAKFYPNIDINGWVQSGGANGYGPGLAFKHTGITNTIHFEPTVSFGGSADTDNDYKAYIKNNGDIRTKANIYVDGRVGIGTNNPTKALLEVNGSVNYSLAARYFNSAGNHENTTATRALSAYFSQHIATKELQVFSDRRIKTNIVDVSDNQALSLIRNIPCRYYEYKDKIANGGGKTIGFIAQEVKEHVPEAVSTQDGYIPDVMKTLEDVTWNNTSMMSNLLQDVSGVKYRFYVSNDLSGNEEVVDLVGQSDNSFIFDKQYTHVFCYGREVNDFHTLDKAKLFALNFSATQELDKKMTQMEKTKLAAAEAEITRLKQQVSVLQSGYSSIMSRLKELERKI